MGIKVYQDGQWKDVSQARVRQDNSWKDVGAGFVRQDDAWKPIFSTVGPTISPTDPKVNGTLTLYRGSDLSGTYAYALKRADNSSMSTNVTTVKSGTLTGSTTTTTYLTSTPNDTNKYFQLEVTYLGTTYYSNIVRVVRNAPVFTTTIINQSPGFYSNSSSTTALTSVNKTSSFVGRWEWNNDDAYDAGSYSYTVSTNTDGQIGSGSGTITGGGRTLSTSIISIPSASTATTITIDVTLSNTGGDTSGSKTVNITADPPSNTVPPSITPTSGYASYTEFTSSTGTWTNDPTLYEYQWQTDYPLGTGTFVNISGQITNKYTPSTLYIGYQIRCRVRAYNGQYSSYVNTSNTVIPSDPLPSAPQSITATGANNSALISWSAPANTGATAIIRYEYNLSGLGWVTNGTSTSVNLTGLTNGTSYTISIRAVNSQGNGTAADKTFTAGCTVGCGDKTYGSWSAWSSCSFCSQTRTRSWSRTCTRADCTTYTENGTDTESQSCEVAPYSICVGSGTWTRDPDCICGGFQTEFRSGTRTFYDKNCNATSTTGCIEDRNVYTGCTCSATVVCGACVGGQQTCTPYGTDCCAGSSYTQSCSNCCDSKTLYYDQESFSCPGGVTSCNSGSTNLLSAGTVTTSCGSFYAFTGGSWYWRCCGSC